MRFAFSLTLVALMTAASQANGIPWSDDLRSAHSAAEQQGKLMLIHFYRDQCVYCEKLEQGAFQSPEVVEAISRNFVPVKIHGGEHPSLAQTFRVSRYPTDVIVTTSGQVLAHGVSPQEAPRYVAMLEQPTTALESARLAQRSAGGSITPSIPTQTNSYASASYATAPGRTAAAETNPVSTSISLGATQPQTPELSAVAERGGEPARGGEEPRREESLDGYCPVSVILDDRWVKGDPRYGAIHFGRVFLFASERARDTFLADPEPFTPVLNGYDVVRFLDSGEVVAGSREWGLKDAQHNRMFFFADEASMNRFWIEHERYTAQALEITRQAVRDANQTLHR